VKLPYIAAIGILASKGLSQAEGVVLILECRKFPNIFVTSTGGKASIMITWVLRISRLPCNGHIQVFIGLQCKSAKRGDNGARFDGLCFEDLVRIPQALFPGIFGPQSRQCFHRDKS